MAGLQKQLEQRALSNAGLATGHCLGYGGGAHSAWTECADSARVFAWRHELGQRTSYDTSLQGILLSSYLWNMMRGRPSRCFIVVPVEPQAFICIVEGKGCMTCLVWLQSYSASKLATGKSPLFCYTNKTSPLDFPVEGLVHEGWCLFVKGVSRFPFTYLCAFAGKPRSSARQKKTHCTCAPL